MGNPVVHFEVLGKDGAALQEFYRSAFDWTFESPNHGINVSDYALVHPQGDVGIPSGGVGSAPDGLTGFATFYVGVPSIEATFDKVEKLGGKRMMGPDIVPGGGPTIGYFTDPEGHVIGLVQV